MRSEKIALLGVCSDVNSSFLRGAAGAPPLIRAAFHSPAGNYFSENGTDLGAAGLFYDAGDITPAPDADLLAAVDAALRGPLGDGLRLVVFGGDHAITYPLVRSVSQFHPGLTILHFDAHPDLYDELDGNRLSHACPFARIMEAGLADRLLQVGIRTATAHQRQQAARFGVEMIEMKDLRDDLVLNLHGPLYLSFDMDVLDPAFAPGLSHWEPGGMSVRQALRLIQAIDAPLVAADIVEFNPARDPTGVTASTAAKIFKEIAAKMLEK